MKSQINFSATGVLLIGILFSFPQLTLGQVSTRAQEKLDEYNRQFRERMEYVCQMSYLSQMLHNKEFHKELEIVPDQIEKLKEVLAIFQQSQFHFTIKNGDRQQEVNRLIEENRIDEAIAIDDEMYAAFDVQTKSLKGDVETVLLPHQIERFRQLGKQKYLKFTSPFRDQFGVAYALVKEIELTPEQRAKLEKRIAAIRKKFYEDVDELREEAINDVLKSFPVENQQDVKRVVGDYYDPDEQLRLAAEKKLKSSAKN